MVFPAPLGPIKPTVLPGVTRNETPVQCMVDLLAMLKGDMKVGNFDNCIHSTHNSDEWIKNKGAFYSALCFFSKSID